MQGNKFIKIFEDCKIVEGFLKNAIYDFSRKKYSIISKKQGEWFKRIDKKNYDYIKKKFDKNKEMSDFLDFLFLNEYIFICEKHELNFFPKLNIEWQNPSHINNLILLRNFESDELTIDTIKNLEKMGLQHLQIFFSTPVDLKKIYNLVNRFSEISLRSIELFGTEELINEILQNHKKFNSSKIVSISAINCKQFKLIKNDINQPFNIIYLKNTIEELFEKSPPDPNYFTIDIRLYMESKFYNTFFNKKLIINEHNKVVSYFNGKVLGDLNLLSLTEIMEEFELKSLWIIKKDVIKICKDCEYRYMCVDSRVPKKINREWSFDTECNYNPYEGKWDFKTETIKK